MRFSEVIGQKGIIEHLVRSADAGRVSHAQLFAGRSGAGILPLALAYVQYLNCTDRRDGDSCGVCANCQQANALAHPDLHFVFPVNKQGKKSNEVVVSDDFMPLFRDAVSATGGYLTDLGKTLKGVIAAKETDGIIKKLSFKSFSGKYKCVLIWLPETMNEEAANKMLKVLEEPWERTVFVLVSERPELLLATIRSRVQEITIPRVDNDVIRMEIEKRETDQEKIAIFTRLSGGDVVEMRSLLANEDGGENEEGGPAGAGREYFDLFCRLMRLSYNDKHLELIGWAEEVATLPRESQRAFLRDVLRLARESYLRHAGLGEIGMLWGEEAAFCEKFAPFIGNDNIEALVEQVESAGAQLYQNGNPTIIFTHFALAVSKLIRKR